MDSAMAPFLKFPKLHRSRPDALAGVTGRARLDRRTKNLTTRLCPGEIAIIDHQDLDRVSADALISRQVAAVVNVAPSISGRYPNLGPQLLMEAGIPLVDNVGPDVFSRVAEGETVRLEAEVLRLGGEIVAKGTLETAENVASSVTSAKAGVAAQIEAFVANTLEYMTNEGALLIDGIRAPVLRTRFEGKHALVVVPRNMDAGNGEGHIPPETASIFGAAYNPPENLWLNVFFTDSEASQSAGRAFLKRYLSRTENRDASISEKVAPAQIAAVGEWGAQPGERFTYLKNIHHPTLVVSGNHDVIVYTVNSLHLVQNLLNAKLILYPDSNHGSWYQNHEEFVFEANRFLNT